MLRAIREIKPRWIVPENVRGIVSWNGGLVFEQVCADMESEGYQIIPLVLPACGVNAPHQRYRTWFLAHSNAAGEWRYSREAKIKRDVATNSKSSGERPGTESKGGNDRSRQFMAWPEQGSNSNDNGEGGIITYTTGKYEREQANEANALTDGGKTRIEFGGGSEHFVAHADGIGLRQQSHGFGKPGFIGKEGSGNDWSDFPTQPPVCSRDDGISTGLAGITISKHRNESLKAYGNAIVPQVAYQIFKAIEQYENL